MTIDCINDAPDAERETVREFSFCGFLVTVIAWPDGATHASVRDKFGWEIVSLDQDLSGSRFPTNEDRIGLIADLAYEAICEIEQGGDQG